eukprot:13485476-Alexandrium_andersonii.AAC.1
MPDKPNARKHAKPRRGNAPRIETQKRRQRVEVHEPGRPEHRLRALHQVRVALQRAQPTIQDPGPSRHSTASRQKPRD